MTIDSRPRTMVSERLDAGPAEGIPLSSWNASQASGAVIIGVHSFGDYGMAFAEMAECLTGCGHMVIAYDQPGFGATAARGQYASDETYREHLAHVVRFAKNHAPNQPLVVIAESFGASVAISTVARGQVSIDGLVLSGPAVRENIPAKPLWDGLISAAADVFGSSSVQLPQANAEMSDMAQLRFASDPMVIRDVRADTYNSIVALADLASLEADQIRVPTLVMYGSNDSIIAHQSIDALMARLGPRGILKVYQGRPHLVLQARDRSDIDQDILSFLASLRQP